MADLEQRLCEAIEPVLARYGVPTTGLPLRAEPIPGSQRFCVFHQGGEGDRGDMTSDVARAALTCFIQDLLVRHIPAPAVDGGILLVSGDLTGDDAGDICAVLADALGAVPDVKPPLVMVLASGTTLEALDDDDMRAAGWVRGR